MLFILTLFRWHSYCPLMRTVSNRSGGVVRPEAQINQQALNAAKCCLWRTHKNLTPIFHLRLMRLKRSSEDSMLASTSCKWMHHDGVPPTAALHHHSNMLHAGKLLSNSCGRWRWTNTTPRKTNENKTLVSPTEPLSGFYFILVWFCVYLKWLRGDTRQQHDEQREHTWSQPA